MKKEWDLLYVSLAEVQDEMEVLIAELPQSKNFGQRAKNLKNKWVTAQKYANDLNEMILPVNPIPVKSPFDHPDFIVAWQMWKEYLQEQHHFDMRTRMEVCALKRLAELAGNDYKEAIRILEFVMSTGYKSFFKPDKKTESQPIIESTENIKY